MRELLYENKRNNFSSKKGYSLVVYDELNAQLTLIVLGREINTL